MIGLAAWLAVPIQPAQAQQPGEVADADCPGPIETGVQVQTSTGTIASTFVAENSGRLTSARVVVQKGAEDAGDYVFEIRTVNGQGVPTDSVLASTVVDDSAADPDAFTPLTAAFAPAAKVTKGQRYALVVGRPGAAEIQLGARFQGGDPCPVSRLFASNTRTTPYGEFTTADLVFSTFVTQSTVSINDVTLTEGDSGTRFARFTVSLSAAADEAVRVSYATSNGTATAGSDYASASGMLTFAPGQTTKTVRVAVSGDRIREPRETFFVSLSSASGAQLADRRARGLIADDD